MRPTRPWPLFGGLALACLALLGLSGTWMAFAYQPTPDHAYASTYAIEHLMPYGWLVRTVHSWCAVLLVAFVAAHVLRALLTRSRAPGRFYAWALGALALLTSIALGFTGRLLPWDQDAYWSTAAAFTLLRRLPLLGDAVAGAVAGGDALGAATLTRFYAAHVALLPAVLTIALVAHVLVVRRERGSEAAGPPTEAGDATAAEAGAEGLPGRAIAIRAATALVLLLCLLAVLAIAHPAPLGLVADPSARPAGAGLAWYLLFR